MKNSQATPSTYRTNEILSELLTTIKKDKADEWFTITEVVRYMKLSEPTIRRYIQRGNLKVSKQTGRILVKRSKVDSYLL